LAQIGVDYTLTISGSLRYADISTDVTFDVADGAKGTRIYHRCKSSCIFFNVRLQVLIKVQ